jgi:hypothetical protein
VEIMSETARTIDELQTELRDLRDRMIPMFEVVAEDWAHRTEPGYPVVFDNVETNGYFGVTLDPGYSLFVMIDRRAHAGYLDSVCRQQRRVDLGPRERLDVGDDLFDVLVAVRLPCVRGPAR